MKLFSVTSNYLTAQHELWNPDKDRVSGINVKYIWCRGGFLYKSLVMEQDIYFSKWDNVNLYHGICTQNFLDHEKCNDLYCLEKIITALNCEE